MYQIKNFTTNDDIKVLDEKGCFQVIEYQRDLSVTPDSAATAYFSAQMNVRRRQLVCDLSKAPVAIQAGAMQWFPELYRGALWQEPDRFCRQRGRAGQRVSRHRQTTDDAHGQMSRDTLPLLKRFPQTKTVPGGRWCLSCIAP